MKKKDDTAKPPKTEQAKEVIFDQPTTSPILFYVHGTAITLNPGPNYVHGTLLPNPPHSKGVLIVERDASGQFTLRIKSQG